MECTRIITIETEMPDWWGFIQGAVLWDFTRSTLPGSLLNREPRTPREQGLHCIYGLSLMNIIMWFIDSVLYSIICIPLMKVTT